MRSSDWPYVVLTIAVFAISGSLFYAVGKRDAIKESAARGEPLVVIPLDNDADDLRETLAVRARELEASRERTGELTQQVEALAQSKARLQAEKTELVDAAAVAEILSAKQAEELDAMASERTALEASVEILQRELDSRRDKIAALQAQVQTAQTEAQAARAEAQTAQTEAQAARAEAQTARAEAQAAQAEAQAAQAEAQAAQAAAHLAAASEKKALEDEPSEDVASAVQVIDASSLGSDRNAPLTDDGAPATSGTAGGDSEVASGLERGLSAYKAGRYEEAFATWMPLAEDGVRRAQFYVGGLYHDGQGVSPDRLEAHYWVSLAQRSGYPPSDELLEKITAQMSDTELREAQARLLASTQGKLE